MRQKDLQDDRGLEIIFLNVGQGDGCILTEPERHDNPRIMVVDAAVGRNVNGFLNWRFRDFPETGDIHAAIITHSDSDHYKGFTSVFQNPNFKIKNIYHNGLVERAGQNLLGPQKKGYQTDLITDHAAVKNLSSDADRLKTKLYPKLFKRAIDSDRIGEITALTTAHGTLEQDRIWMPGFAPSDAGPMKIEVLGPVVETAVDGKPKLRAFGKDATSGSMDNGKTENGHCVLLRLNYIGFTVLFGGDLNTRSEKFLTAWYGNNRVVPPLLSGRDPLAEVGNKTAMVKAARKRLSVDLMKTCHNG